MDYQHRLIDDDLDDLFGELAAVSLEGPKGVGKTATALQRATTVLRLDDEFERILLEADPGRLLHSPPPVLIDEWQRWPPSWDLVRRAVDADRRGAHFLLTGSATPTAPPTHSGAGRIVTMRMRPLSLAERRLADAPTVSLGRLLDGDGAPVTGTTSLSLEHYVDEILASGFPGLRGLSQRASATQLAGYLQRIVDKDILELGHRVRRPATMYAWLRAYAAATASTASYSTILDAATAGDTDKPARTTTAAYREALTQLWLLDPVPGWVPTGNRLARLAQAPKHHLADPALAAHAVGATRRALLYDDLPALGVRLADGPFVGALFESLVTLSVRAYAQRVDATVSHLRTKNGDHEVDLIVEGADRRVVALEVKLTPTVTDRDVRHLHWLRERIGPLLADMAVVTTGPYAYRRPDGVAVVPAALLGP